MIYNIKNIELTEQRYNEILELYNVFSKTDQNVLTFEKFKIIVTNLRDNNNHNIFFYIDDNDTIVGAVTLLIEQKIIHNGKCCGHIEDFVVHKDYQKQGIGTKLIDYATRLAIENNCYKCILDCDPDLENYYAKGGFMKKGTYMAKYF